MRVLHSTMHAQNLFLPFFFFQLVFRAKDFSLPMFVTTSLPLGPWALLKMYLLRSFAVRTGLRDVLCTSNLFRATF